MDSSLFSARIFLTNLEGRCSDAIGFLIRLFRITCSPFVVHQCEFVLYCAHLLAWIGDWRTLANRQNPKSESNQNIDDLNLS